MYLKSLKAIGFKSFCEPITMDFTDKISGVVGPNGSGKSNVVDAVRWVLGEQSVKSLRGEGSMSDVIFSGSKSRKAANYASVTLIFDNKDRYLAFDQDEVEIKRTIYKSGENEYYINNGKCRLKDILELFRDTGASKESFNIISQGDIANILSSKPEDRRIIFEDAAGVLKYKKRKEEAERKIAQTNANLNRVNDIIDELEGRVGPLKEASEKAKISVEDKKQLEQVEVALIVNDIDKYNIEYKEAKDNIVTLNDKISALLSSSSLESSKIETLKVEINRLNDDLYAKQQLLVESTSLMQKYQGEKNLISERSKYNSDDMKLHDNIILLKENLLSVDNELDILNKEIESVEKEGKELSTSLTNKVNELNKLDKEKNELLTNSSNLVRELTNLNHKKEVLANSIENNLAMPSSVKSVLDNPKLSNMYGTVGKLFETDEEYATAIETSLGAAINYIICENDSEAKDAIRYLKNNNLGRATFYPLDVIKSRSIDVDSYNIVKKITGFVDIASNLIKYDTKYKNVMHNLLGNVIISTDIDAGTKISKEINNKYKVVSLDGNIVNVGGSLTGGSIKNKTSIISEKYELENVLKDINKKQNDLSIVEDKINGLDTEYGRLNDEKNKILSSVNIKSDLLREKENKKSELDIRKESIILELSNNQNVVNNVISKDEETIINKYYEEKNKVDSLKLEIENLVSKIAKEKDNLTHLETNLKIDNGDYNKYLDELKKNEIKESRLDVKLDTLLTNLENDYTITYEKAKSEYILEIDEDEARKKVNKLKSEIRSLGDVNVSAIEEYEEVNNRYTFLNSQKEDLLKAEDMLLDIIKQMDEVMKEKFTETFSLVQESFSKTFKELFNGGDASLSLTDPSDILNTGVEIKALPPGKKLQHISLLSGGEKTLTAIALLFSILKIRPVPFAILDEVEAALDEVNVDNFGRYLSSLKNKTQFIVITHKKKTMEYADVLYGITMQESGVSKLVSVKLEGIKE